MYLKTKPAVQALIVDVASNQSLCLLTKANDEEFLINKGLLAYKCPGIAQSPVIQIRLAHPGGGPLDVIQVDYTPQFIDSGEDATFQFWNGGIHGEVHMPLEGYINVANTCSGGVTIVTESSIGMPTVHPLSAIRIKVGSP